MNLICSSCQKNLSIPDILAGRKFSCPVCKVIQTAPKLDGSGTNDPGTSEDQKTKSCPYCSESILINAIKCKHCGERLDGSGGSGSNPRRNLEPHRGGLIPTLGILSLFMFPPLGIFAWIMGAGDLSKMHNGFMDNSGEGPTRGGYICGMLSTIFLVIILFLLCLFVPTVTFLGQKTSETFNTTATKITGGK